MKKNISTLPFHGTPAQEKQLREVIEAHRGQKGCLMPIMQQAQEIYGYLPLEVQRIIAQETGCPVEEVYGIATFYAQFALTPKGKYKISVCLGTACYVKGAQKILDRITEVIGIGPDQCTEDGKFSLEACRCIGACGLAPVMTVNDEVYGRLQESDVDEILKQYMWYGLRAAKGEVRVRELSLNVLDVAQNSISAGASLIEIELDEQPEQDLLRINIFDNGRGMTPEQVKRVTDPFYTTRTTRKVGLGVPLFRMAAEMAGGGLTIESEVGRGTRVFTTYRLSHVDRMPVGDLGGTVAMLIQMNPALDFVYRRTLGAASYTLDTRELRQILEDTPLNTPEVSAWIAEYLEENETTLLAGGSGSADTDSETEDSL